MTILFAGGELTCFTISDPANVTEATVSATYRDATYARCSILVSSSAQYAEGALTAAATTFWFHGEVTCLSVSSGNPIAIFLDSSGTAVFRLHMSAASTLQMQYWSGSAWTNIGSTYTMSATTKYTFDLKIVCGSSGSAALYSSGTLVASGTASMTSVAQVARTRLTTNASGSHWSQVIAADESTVGWKLATLAPTANGANVAWTNDYTAIDETIYDDADYISSATANDVETYVAGDAPSGLIPRALVVSARAKLGATGPQNLQLAVRSGGANYFSSNVSGLTSGGFTSAVAMFATDPATSAAWTLANLNAAEIGVKSIA